MLEIGYPRNDILFKKNNEEDIVRLKRRLGLPLDKKILLYAPTFRDDEFNENSSYKFSPKLSFQKLKEALQEEYILIVKYHYLIMDYIDWFQHKGFIYHFDQSNDIAELFLVSDMLITDLTIVYYTDQCSFMHTIWINTKMICVVFILITAGRCRDRFRRIPMN